MKLRSTKHPVSAINTGKGHSKNQPGSITVTSQHFEPWNPNLGLTSVEKSFLDNDQDICDKLVDAGMKLLTRDFPQFEYHSSVLDHNHLAFSNDPTIHIHHTGNHHFVTSSSTTGQVIIYDSLNLTPTEELFLQLSCLYSPHKEIVPTIYQANISSTQFGSHDCGLFALAYAVEIAKGNDPSWYTFDQTEMRPHFFACFESGKLESFPKICNNIEPTHFKEITKNISEFHKWSKPKKTVKPVRININNEATTTTSNRYASLDHHENKSSKTKNAKQPKLSSTDTSVPKNGHHYKTKYNPASLDTLIVNLSDRVLSPAEKSVLELGLSFSPSNKNYDRIPFATDFYQFVRRLKLCDYFANLGSHYEHSDGYKDEPLDNGVWVEKNPDWYPEKVKKNGSKGLQTFIENTTHDLKAHLSHKDQSYWNNMSLGQ